MVERVTHLLRKYAHGWAFLAVLTVFFLLKVANEPSKDHFLQTFQDRFLQQERALDLFGKQLERDWSTLSEYEFSEKYRPGNTPFYISIYRNDSLIYWNNNDLPINAFADLHFPNEGLTHLQNGWYYSTEIRSGKTIMVASFGIQRTYPYENDQLKNTFFEPFPQAKALIGFNKTDEHVVRDSKGEPLFQLELDTTQNGGNIQIILYFLILLAWVIVWHFIVTRSRKPLWKWIVAVLLLAAFVLCKSMECLNWMHNSELFDSQLLALNEWIPSLGELMLSVLVAILVVLTLMQIRLAGKTSIWWFYLGGLLIPLGLHVLPATAISLIENSTIPLELNTILELNQFTFYVLALLFIGVVMYGYVLHRLFAVWLHKEKRTSDLVFLGWLLISLMIQMQIPFVSWEVLLWPFLLIILIYAIHRFEQGNWSFTSYLIALLIAAAATAVNVQKEWGKKERQERELYANELADNRDITAEMEFTLVREKLVNEPYLNRLFNVDEQPSFNELKEALERRIFNGYWERFDVDVYYFRPNITPSMNGFTEKEFEQLLEAHGDRSEIDSNLFFIRDFTSQFSYVFRHKIVSKNGELIPIYGTLKSKKIPEEIGFPRLLISQQANVFESLEAYSIAKYYKGRLITNYGDYSYPIRLASLHQGQKADQYWFESDGFDHFVLRKSSDDAIVLSRKVPTWLSLVTTIAFLLVGTGSCYALVVVVRARLSKKQRKNIPLATRIQLVMIGLVFVSLLGFSVGSSRFVNEQYADYTNDIIREKIRSVNREGLQRMEERAESKVIWTREELAYQLRNWSQIFITDLNVYSLNGHLIASSRPKIYNIGLLGEQMDPDAMIALSQEKRAEFIHEEYIGNLSYLSAYVPLITKNGTMLGYLNLQHFDQQNVFEAQVQRFFMAIVNVFMLLLVLSIIGAVVVSNWITSPLRLIRKSFANVALGKRNQPIVYNSSDEIGELVAEYNNKIKEIEAAALQLAQTERESAWREMAKQVAHEIKNPLTPMKLSIQQLQRVFDPNDPRSKEKLDKVSHSIIEQIDALTHIANAFSSFAKLPQPKMERIDFTELLRSVDALFGANGEIDWVCQYDENDACWVKADRDMLLRVLNNVITNGIQAVPFDRKAHILVSATKTNDFLTLLIRDNGTGIPVEQRQRIFEPYFTTKSTGTGLGLAMVRQILESHGGTISVKDTGEEGTTIAISLPLE